MWTCICMHIYVCVYVCVKTISEKRYHEFEKEQGGNHWRFYREQGKVKNDAIVL